MVTLPVIARSAQPFPLTVACPLLISTGGCWRILKVDVEVLSIDKYHYQSGHPLPLFTFYCKLIESVMMMACVVRLSLLEAVHQRAYITASASIGALSSWRLRVRLFQLHCLLWSLDGGHTLLYSEAPPWLVTKPSVYTMRSESWCFFLFFLQAGFLNLFCLLAILCLFKFLLLRLRIRRKNHDNINN